MFFFYHFSIYVANFTLFCVYQGIEDDMLWHIIKNFVIIYSVFNHRYQVWFISMCSVLNRFCHWTGLQYRNFTWLIHYNMCISPHVNVIQLYHQFKMHLYVDTREWVWDDHQLGECLWWIAVNRYIRKARATCVILYIVIYWQAIISINQT